MDRHQLLSQFEVYATAPRELREAMLASGQVMQLDGGARVFSEGEGCQVVPFISSGAVRVFKRNGARREVTLYHVGAGDSCVMTMSCIVNGCAYPASADVVLTAPLVFLGYSPALMLNWIEQFPHMRAHYQKMMHKRMLHLFGLIEDLTFTRMDRRIASFLLQKFSGGGVFTPSVNITHEQIADELGSAREVVSRLLKEFERSGAVELSRGQVRMTNENMLRMYAGQSQ